ncbi:MAG: hypothetical protein ACRD3D_05545 [Terriglobia bacterium]
MLTVMTVFVAIAAVAILIDTILVLGFCVVAWRIYKRASAETSKLKIDGEAIILTTKQIADAVLRLRDPINSTAASLAEVSRLVRDRAVSVDSAVGEIVERTRAQTARIDLLVTNVVTQVETAVATAHRAVISPVQEIAAVAKGLQAGFDSFFSRRRTSTVREGPRDEEMFI